MHTYQHPSDVQTHKQKENETLCISSRKRLSTLANNVAHLVASKKILHQSADLFFFSFSFLTATIHNTPCIHRNFEVSLRYSVWLVLETRRGEKKKKCLTAVACFTKLHFFLKLTFFYDCTASYTTKESFQLEKEKKTTKKPPRSLASPSERKGKQNKKEKKQEDAIKQACCKSTEICTDPGNHINNKQYEFPFCCCTSKLRNKAFLLFFFFSSILLCSSHPNVHGAQKRAHELGSFYLPRKTRTKKKKNHNEVTLCTRSRGKNRGMASVRNGSGPSQMFPPGWAGVPKSRLLSPACRLASKDWAQVVVGPRFEKGRRKTTRLEGVLKDGGNCEDGN